MKLIFVYNADSGILNALKDTLHKTVSANTYACNLCRVTYGTFFMHHEWEEYIDTLPPETEFLHRDEFRARYPAHANTALPALFFADGNKLDVALTTTQINSAKNVKDLAALVDSALAPGGVRSSTG